jgi:hypothetical protein
MICLSVPAQNKATRKQYLFHVQFDVSTSKNLGLVDKRNKLMQNEENKIFYNNNVYKMIASKLMP